MYFDTKNYLKSNHYHIFKHLLSYPDTENIFLGFFIFQKEIENQHKNSWKQDKNSWKFDVPI
jgi:hypothetical protein